MAIDRITVRGARQHNLKNINVEIPRDRLTVITGLSGSGKSSLAFDTIYAEGQRGLAGAGESGDDRQAVARNLDADVLQVVLARPAHRDAVYRHCLKPSRPTTVINPAPRGNDDCKRPARVGQAGAKFGSVRSSGLN